jgi:HAD superfamily hydrolase (TIGR01549 family)
MRSVIKAIFFDIGGTLRVTRQGVGRDLTNIQQMMTLLGEKCTADEFIDKLHRGAKQYRKWCKPNYIELNEAELLTRFLLPDYPEEFVRANAITLNQLWRESRRKYVLPDMVETMRTLAARGYKLGLISNTTSSVEGHRMLADQGLTDLFSTVILSAVFGRRKPHPSIFLEAARQAGVHPWECAYVGDRASRDLIGALQSGYGKTIIIHTEGYVLDEFDQDDFEDEKDKELMLKPDHRISFLSQLTEIFPDLTNVTAGFAVSRPDYLYDVALSTMWGIDQDMPFDETFEAAKSIGIARFELNHKVTATTLEKYERDHHYVSTVHDPCGAPITYDDQKLQDKLISSLDEEKRKQGVEIACRTIDLACQLGAKSVVLHPGSIDCDRSKDNRLRKLYEQGKKETPEFAQVRAEMFEQRKQLVSPHMRQVMKSLNEIMEYNANCKGVALALENRYRFFDLPFPDELEEMLALGDGNAYGFQYDIGHAVALDALALVKHEEWLERFGRRMIGVHIHDVRGITDHLAPGQGSVNYGTIAPYLPESCLKTLEIGPQTTIEEIAKGLELLTAAGMINRL